jgi:hypothetical protein
LFSFLKIIDRKSTSSFTLFYILVIATFLLVFMIQILNFCFRKMDSHFIFYCTGNKKIIISLNEKVNRLFEHPYEALKYLDLANEISDWVLHRKKVNKSSLFRFPCQIFRSDLLTKGFNKSQLLKSCLKSPSLVRSKTKIEDVAHQGFVQGDKIILGFN